MGDCVFYRDENGFKADKDIHDFILDKPDRALAAHCLGQSIKAARALSLTDREIERLFGLLVRQQVGGEV